MILYCNGPSCGKSKRTSEQLVLLGYSNVRRYQLGMPVWRALSLTVQTDLPGFDYIYRGDGTAVFVDARTPAEYAADTVPGAVNVQKGEATAANDDGRLPFTDKGTRVVVFGNTAEQALVVAAEIAKRAYWNSSYFGGTFADLVTEGFTNRPPVAVSHNVTVPAGSACTVNINPQTLDNGSYDPDTGDVLTLSLDPMGPFGVGQNRVALVATDRRGASSASTTILTVADSQAPAISRLAVDKPLLWPPDGRMELVTLAYTTADNCEATTQLTITTRELDGHDSSASDRRSSDWEIVDTHHVKLRAERDRTYSITVTATDDSGNGSARSVAVRVAGTR